MSASRIKDGLSTISGVKARNGFLTAEPETRRILPTTWKVWGGSEPDSEISLDDEGCHTDKVGKASL